MISHNAVVYTDKKKLHFSNYNIYRIGTRCLYCT